MLEVADKLFSSFGQVSFIFYIYIYNKIYIIYNIYLHYMVIDIAILSDMNVREKEYKKLKKYQGMEEELEKMWRVKAKIIPLIIGAHGTDH